MLDEIKQVVSDHIPGAVWADEQAPVHVARSTASDVSVVVVQFDVPLSTRVTVLRRGVGGATCESPERITPDYLRRWLPLACDLVRLEA